MVIGEYIVLKVRLQKLILFTRGDDINILFISLYLRSVLSYLY